MGFSSCVSYALSGLALALAAGAVELARHVAGPDWPRVQEGVKSATWVGRCHWRCHCFQFDSAILASFWKKIRDFKGCILGAPRYLETSRSLREFLIAYWVSRRVKISRSDEKQFIHVYTLSIPSPEQDRTRRPLAWEAYLLSSFIYSIIYTIHHPGEETIFVGTYRDNIGMIPTCHGAPVGPSVALPPGSAPERGQPVPLSDSGGTGPNKPINGGWNIEKVEAVEGRKANVGF